MIWNKKYFLNAWLIFFMQACSILYTFSGISLSKDIRTFSVEECFCSVSLAPSGLEEKFSEEVVLAILQRTQLNHKTSEPGDIQFYIEIVKFDYSPVAVSASSEDAVGDSTRLTINIKVTYVNNADENAGFKNKEISQYQDMSSDLNIDTEQPRLIGDVFKKLIDDLLKDSVCNW